MKTQNIKINSNKQKLSDPIFLDVVYKAKVHTTMTPTKKGKQERNWNKHKQLRYEY